MAKMFPMAISETTESEAERILYDEVRDRLDDSYVVFHSVPLQGIDEYRQPRDSDSDFVIAHPERGILVLEVKGGLVEWHPATGMWTSTSHTGHIYKIKD